MPAKDDLCWTMRIPVLSTGHLREDTLTRLEDRPTLDGGVGDMARYPEGAFVRLLDAEGAFLFDPAMFPDVADVAAWLRTNFPNQTWVRFDCDGDLVDALHHFDW